MVYRTSLADIRTLGRITQGVKVMTKLTENDVVISMSAFRERTWEDFENLPQVQPKKARAASTNGHTPIEDIVAAADPDAEETGDAEAPEAEDVLEASDAGDAEEDAESLDAAEESPEATEDSNADGGSDTTVSMWHAMQAPLFSELEEPEEDGSDA